MVSEAEIRKEKIFDSFSRISLRVINTPITTPINMIIIPSPTNIHPRIVLAGIQTSFGKRNTAILFQLPNDKGA
jgi:hypothetical protein